MSAGERPLECQDDAAADCDHRRAANRRTYAGTMAHRFARSARLLAFSPGRAAAAAALPAALCAQQAKAEANEDINKETVAAAAAAAAVGYAAVAATQANAKAKDAQERLKALEVRAAKATSAPSSS